MSLPWIVKGDKTSHGGTVLEGEPSFDTHGKPVALVGHMTSCPKCKGGPFPIVTGASDAICNGRPLARHGDKTACGATLISSQAFSSYSTEKGRASGSRTSASSSLPSPLFSSSSVQPFDEAFTLRDRMSGEPLSNFPYRIVKPDGSTVEGITDAQGKTKRVSTECAAILILEAKVGENDGW